MFMKASQETINYANKFQTHFKLFLQPNLQYFKNVMESFEPFHATGRSIYTLSKHEKVSGFLIFLGGVERN